MKHYKNRIIGLSNNISLFIYVLQFIDTEKLRKIPVKIDTNNTKYIERYLLITFGRNM